MPAILIYAFSNQWGTNISRRTLLDLQKLISPLVKERVGGDFDFRLIFFHPKAFFQKYIYHSNYDLIIGLGDGSDRCHHIRIETIATNRYGNSPIDNFSPFKLELSLPVLDLVDPSYFDISEFAGTYNCNWIIYQTQLHIYNSQLATRHLFLHLPRRANSRELAFHIQNLLINNALL